MKIAIPYKDGKINGHFGGSSEFIVFEIENGKILGKKILVNESQHNYAKLTQMLSNEGVEVIIAGSMGRPMANSLAQSGFRVITGVSGDAEKAAAEFMSGQLDSKPSGCSCSRPGYGLGRHYHP
ncbi:uncharacterized conserved protein [Pelotomaculum thermopropionicum SI]|uniref:Uncharacterized conserved protein n=1 Tax=Pelotomaculum thermopropionicum (strain DSM 13744 / JCM 10971 / SI) TaxID=370438 RepID=A5D1V9_PELTS|nr:uncharacterized conserved protein [Pelotomaculum thermopropionicum SI]